MQTCVAVNNYCVKARLLLFLQFFGVILFLLSAPIVCSAETEVRIGVLAYRGYNEALKMWSPTATYLTNKIPALHFSIVPLDFREIGPAVQEGKVDFVLANTSIYVELEALYGATRILTLKNLRKGGVYTLFGGVIFCRNDRSDIRTLNDLKGKSFMGVEENSLGGWQMAWLELKKSGIDPYKNFKSLRFGDMHDSVVYAVRDGEVDAGTVRTDTLERMSDEGLIDPDMFRIINQRHATNFPFALSTSLYPEWPFAKAKHTSDEISQKVAIALMSMPSDSPAARTAKIAGWTTPLDYQPVHELMKELRIGPYKNIGKISLADFLRRYWYLFILTIAGLSVMGSITVYVIRLNGRLHKSHLAIKRANTELWRKNEELKEAQRRINTIIESSLDMIIAVDSERRIVEFNISAQQTFGYSIEEVFGKHIDMIYDDPEDGLKIQEALQKEGLYVGEIANRRKNGEIFTSFISASYLLDPDGNYIGSMGISRDITERKHAEHLLKLQQEQLEVLNVGLEIKVAEEVARSLEKDRVMLQQAHLADLGALSAGITHEINTPLTYIKGNIELLKLETDSRPETDELFDSINEGIGRITNIIESMKEISGFSKKEKAPANIYRTLIYSTRMIHNRAKQISGIYINDRPFNMNMDRDTEVFMAELAGQSIEQVWIIILNNALDEFIKSGIPFEQRYIRVEISKNYDRIQVIIRDNAGGIPEDIIDRVFDMFVSTKPQMGTGIGLNVAKKIIEDHDGLIKAYNDESGAVFEVLL